MKRYTNTAYIDDGIALSEMVEDAEGGHVKYEDVRHKLELFEEMKRDIENECADCKVEGFNNCSPCHYYGWITSARALQEAAK